MESTGQEVVIIGFLSYSATNYNGQNSTRSSDSVSAFTTWETVLTFSCDEAEEICRGNTAQEVVDSIKAFCLCPTRIDKSWSTCVRGREC